MSDVKIGLFGGTFDPVHVGHLIVAQDVVAALDLRSLVFVPTGVPPHKDPGDVTAGRIRLEMLRAAVEGDPRIAVTDLELRRGGASYTVETLREYRERNPDARVFFVMGADQFQELHSWREPEAVAELAELVIMAREGSSPWETGAPLRIRHRVVPVTRVDISSTEIRRRVREGKPIRYLVPQAVERIILREHLYGESHTTSGKP